MLKQFKASAAVLLTSTAMGVTLVDEAMAAGPQEVKKFTTSVESKGDPNLRGAVRKNGKQLFVGDQPAQVETDCGVLEVLYSEKGNQGTFWGVNISDKDNGIVVDQAPKNDKAVMVPSNGYLAYDKIGGQLSSSWKDVVSKNVTSLRVTLPETSNCQGSSKPGTTPPGEELPGGGCQCGAEFKGYKLDEETQRLFDKYALAPRAFA